MTHSKHGRTIVRLSLFLLLFVVATTIAQNAETYDFDNIMKRTKDHLQNKNSRILTPHNEKSCGCKDSGQGIGLGNALGQAVEGIARQPEAHLKIRRAFVVGALMMVNHEVGDIIIYGENEEREELADNINHFMLHLDSCFKGECPPDE